MRRHGKRVEQVFRSIAGEPRLAERIVPALPFIHADLLFCARNEMVVHLDDLLRRRMPLLILAKLSGETLRSIAGTVADAMGWDEAAIISRLKPVGAGHARGPIIDLRAWPAPTRGSPIKSRS